MSPELLRFVRPVLWTSSAPHPPQTRRRCRSRHYSCAAPPCARHSSLQKAASSQKSLSLAGDIPPPRALCPAPAAPRRVRRPAQSPRETAVLRDRDNLFRPDRVG